MKTISYYKIVTIGGRYASDEDEEVIWQGILKLKKKGEKWRTISNFVNLNEKKENIDENFKCFKTIYYNKNVNIGGCHTHGEDEEVIWQGIVKLKKVG